MEPETKSRPAPPRASLLSWALFYLIVVGVVALGNLLAFALGLDRPPYVWQEAWEGLKTVGGGLLQMVGALQPVFEGAVKLLLNGVGVLLLGVVLALVGWLPIWVVRLLRGNGG